MSNQFYHLIVFLACLASLLALIMSGHDTSPLLQSLLGGGVGGSAIGAFQKLSATVFGDSITNGSKQGGYVLPKLALFIFAFTALSAIIAGCATLKTDPVATSCASASAAIKTLTLAKNNGFISMSEQKLVNDAISIVDPICSQKVEPPSSVAAVNALNSAVGLLTQAAAAHPNGT